MSTTKEAWESDPQFQRLLVRQFRLAMSRPFEATDWRIELFGENMPTTMELQRDIMICAGNMASCAVERALTMPRGQHPMFGIRVQSDKWAVKYQEEIDRLQALVLLMTHA